MSESIRSRLEQQAQKALIQHAIFRMESALMVGATILLSVFFTQPFPWWPVWGWPLLGVLGEIAIVVSSITDKGEQQEAIERLFREQYDMGGIRDRQLRNKLEEARRYHERIQQVVAQQKSGLLRDRMVDTTAQVYDWIAGMVRLARRIDAYRSDDIIRRDTQDVPKELRALLERRNRESNPHVRAQLETNLASKQQQAENLEELRGRMDRADLQLDQSLAALGTVYSQVMLVGTSEVDSSRADRLREDIRGEVLALQDLVESINEVYSYPAGEVDPQAAAAEGTPEQTRRPQEMRGRR